MRVPLTEITREQSVTLIIGPLQNRFFRTDWQPGRKKRALRVMSDITFPVFGLVCFYFEGGMTVPPVNSSFSGLLPAFLSVCHALSAMVNGRKSSFAKTRFGSQ
ncbi:hypothetical protein [Bacteroides fragilis]|uniref:hypothetical protein n=1 Tax=Bacteroides fragilis TaxID=817 RepID=UPI001C6FD86C|nr:hypothetical protein [Bacteroides fragilis]MBW9279447.1 hypothetical protein [Bacteroides fragilis]